MSDDRQAPRGLPFLPPVDPAAARSLAGTAVTAEAFAGFLADGDEDVARWALSRQLAVRPRTVVYDTFVRDAMQLVGERWLTGRWTVSEEHLASRTLARVLGSVAPVPHPLDRIAPVAVLAGVAGEEHSIGLMALAHVLAEAGFATSDLGPDVPAEDLVRYAAKAEARLVSLTATTAVRDETLRDTVAALRALPARPAVFVGGRLADLADLADLGADWSGTSLVECDRAARALAVRLTASADS